MKNWQGIPTTRLTLGGEVMVPRDNRTLVFSTELLNYIIPFATQGKIGHYKATITRCDLSPRFFCIDATSLCEFENDKI